jgi:Amt family ammonium transporter
MKLFLHERGLAALLIAALVGAWSVPGLVWAQEEEVVVESETVVEEPADLGVGYALDNAMLFITAVMVMFMQAGFAMVEAGFNASKNAVNILFKNTMDFCVGALLFFTIGFSLMYPGSYSDPTYVKEGWFGYGSLGLNDYVSAPDRTFSPECDWLFQCVFAATAATIVSGAVAGRIRVSAYLVYSAVLTGFVYPVSGYWKWGGGWLTQFDGGMAFQDFAGSCVVHGVGGFAGLAGAILLGPRIGRFIDGKSIPMPGHSLPLAALGVFILWFGWYGFNPGSQLAFQSTGDIDAVMHIAVTTTLAAAAGGISATLISWVLFGRPDLSLALNGILGGLVGITAGCDCFSDWWAIVVGVVAAVLVIAATLALDKLQIDDPVGAFPVHGVCGMWGCMAIGILPNTHLGTDTTFGIQLTGTVAICAWSFVTLFILFSILKGAGMLRSTPDEEKQGLDISEHGMQAYGLVN